MYPAKPPPKQLPLWLLPKTDDLCGLGQRPLMSSLPEAAAEEDLAAHCLGGDLSQTQLWGQLFLDNQKHTKQCNSSTKR